jgi:hypothetical protein
LDGFRLLTQYPARVALIFKGEDNSGTTGIDAVLKLRDFAAKERRYLWSDSGSDLGISDSRTVGGVVTEEQGNRWIDF